jgi:hypothetical protein
LEGEERLASSRYAANPNIGFFAQRSKKVHFGGNTGLASGSFLPYPHDILGVME